MQGGRHAGVPKMSLAHEIDKAKRSVITDAYQMSIGEIVNLYKDAELIINPDFQRLYRWDLYQKSRLFESILLGIPLPSIFVFETEDRKWELVDGLQRLSTLLEFMGLLTDPDTNEPKPPIALIGTKYLPSLQGAVWEASSNDVDVRPLDKNQQISIRRSRLSIEILKQPSDVHTKYDLFQRLNSGGTVANNQELRNVIAIMINPEFLSAVKQTSESDDFLALIQITEEARKSQRHVELVMRFLVYLLVDYDPKKDVQEYIDDGIVQIAEKSNFVRGLKVLEQTFALIRKSVGDDGLKRIENGLPKGSIGLGALEAIGVGIGKNLRSIKKLSDPELFVSGKITGFWKQTEISRFSVPGLRGTQRIQRTLPFGETWFTP
jgi:hypothetical protein